MQKPVITAEAEKTSPNTTPDTTPISKESAKNPNATEKEVQKVTPEADNAQNADWPDEKTEKELIRKLMDDMGFQDKEPVLEKKKFGGRIWTRKFILGYSFEGKELVPALYREVSLKDARGNILEIERIPVKKGGSYGSRHKSKRFFIF